MSVYDEICNWIADDVVYDIQNGEYTIDEVDEFIDMYIETNMQDLWDSINDRTDSIKKLVMKKLSEGSE